MRACASTEVDVRDYESLEACAAAIIKIDDDPELFASYKKTPPFLGGVVPEDFQWCTEEGPSEQWMADWIPLFQKVL